MNHANFIRERIVCPEVEALCTRLFARVQLTAPDETEVLAILRRRGPEDLAVPLAQFLMTALGAAEPAVKDPRYDKTRRAIAKQTPKGPRGVKAGAA